MPATTVIHGFYDSSSASGPVDDEKIFSAGCMPEVSLPSEEQNNTSHSIMRNRSAPVERSSSGPRPLARDKEWKWHISVLELYAMFLSLKCFYDMDLLSRHHVLVCSDNVCINLH